MSGITNKIIHLIFAVTVLNNESISLRPVVDIRGVHTYEKTTNVDTESISRSVDDSLHFMCVWLEYSKPDDHPDYSSALFYLL